MSISSNVVRRAGSANYYARLSVPVDLLDVYGGKRELWKSLSTKEPKEAKIRVLAVLQDWHSQFAEMRRRRAPTATDLQGAVWDHYRSELDHHRRDREALPTQAQLTGASAQIQADIATGAVSWSDDQLVQLDATVELLAMRDRAKLDRDFRARRKAALIEHLRDGETALVEWAADAVIAREGLLVEKGTPRYRELCHGLQRAELEGIRQVEAEEAGEFGRKPQDPIIKPALPFASNTTAAPGESVMELYEEYAADNPRGVKADTLAMNRQIVGLFDGCVGPRFPAKRIDKKAVREWKRELRKFPIKAAEIREFRGLTFAKIIQANEKLGKPTISPRTVNKYLSALGAFCKWLSDHGHLDENPVTGMHASIDKDETKVRPYTTKQLQMIFTSPLFTGCESEAKLHRPGDLEVRDHRYWLPLLSLFTGARMGELAQLLVDDVRQEHGQWILHITREGDTAKSTKTKGSQRVVPVHPELVKLGFPEYHAKALRKADKRLFPDIEPDTRGQLTGHYSRSYGRYVAKIGVKVDKTLNFHSYRHGMADALRRAGYRDEEFKFLLGHTGATTTGRYGVLPEGELSQRVKLIKAVSFPGLDLLHLAA